MHSKHFFNGWKYKYPNMYLLGKLALKEKSPLPRFWDLVLPRRQIRIIELTFISYSVFRN